MTTALRVGESLTRTSTDFFLQFHNNIEQ